MQQLRVLEESRSMNNMSRIAEAFGFTNTQSAKNQSHTQGEIETTGTDASGR